ncbi:hypothetical protein [Senegalimassilia anaerobia]
MEVDHLVPVAAAQKSRVARQILASIGAESVNDAPNLVPSCHACNARKGSKTGLWLIRGVLGAHRSYWIALRIAQALFASGSFSGEALLAQPTFCVSAKRRLSSSARLRPQKPRSINAAMLAAL